MRKGCTRFLDEDGHFYAMMYFTNCITLIIFSIMKYKSVISAILKYLKLLSIEKTYIRRLPSQCLQIYFVPILVRERSTKIIYNYLSVKEVNPTTTSKWKWKLDIYCSRSRLFQGLFLNTNYDSDTSYYI